MRFVILCFLLLAGAVVPVAAAPGDEIAIMTPDEARPGMKGYGLTVFEGVRPERFDVEVIGVLKGSIGPRKDMILCRLSHPRLEGIGVIGGMSGSPIYIEGKLLGAVAYGYTWSKEAIAGVSSIVDMLEVYDSVGAAPSPESASSGDGGGFIDSARPRSTALRPVYINADTVPAEVLSGLGASGKTVTMAPLGVPLMVGAACPASMRIIEDTFGPMGFQLVPSGAAGAGAKEDAPDPDEFGGGYSLAVPYMTGDMEMSAVGTVTYRRGDKLVAFGHPMFQKGGIDMPMAISRVETVVPSLQRPFKIGSSLGTVGTISQDRLSAIGGSIGESPRTVPITVALRAPEQGIDRTFNYQAVRHRDLLPSMARVALTESIASATKAEGEASADILYRIEFSNGRIVEKHDFVSGNFILAPVSFALGLDIVDVLFNPFEDVAVDRIDIEVTVTDRLEQARLIYAVPTRKVYKPGETVRLRVTYQPWRKEIATTTADIELPDTLANGSYTVTLHGSSSRTMLEAKRAPGRLSPLDLDQLIDIVRIHYPSNRSYLTVETRNTGLTLRGEEIPSLPPSLLSAINQSCKEFNSSAPLTILAEEIRAWPYELVGYARATITVDKLGQRR